MPRLLPPGCSPRIRFLRSRLYRPDLIPSFRQRRTISQSQPTALPSLTSNDRQRARVAQETTTPDISIRTRAGEKSVSALAIVSNGSQRPTQLKCPSRDRAAEPAFIRYNRGPVLAAALAAFACLEPAFATETLRCARFSREEIPAPTPSQYPSALERLQFNKSGREIHSLLHPLFR